ncbi:MAG: DNA repair protein RecO [Synechococcales cyanobacterium K44_A2020_017]|nr:DNA repair protein RecO [Synechococcales cyanobacterium K32_A2020_035]MBF2094803.1 DNA repair protein RecO [Synechococcales cyanobacterium K44_A2020_017]
MPKTYKAIGINLKGIPLGESDRLLTLLTREQGLMRVVAPGARKHHSKLGGRSELFVVNDLLIATGRSLDKIVQAETIESFPGLSRDLRKLTAGQYLAELALGQAMGDQPQDELFDLVVEHLGRIAALPGALAIATLTHAMFHLLTLAGLSPQVQLCCMTQQPLSPNFSQAGWRVGFSPAAGGIVQLDHAVGLPRHPNRPRRPPIQPPDQTASPTIPRHRHPARVQPAIASMGALELAVLQRLSQPHLIQADGRLMMGGTMDGTAAAAASLVEADPIPPDVWLSLERLLRHYAQYHFDRPIRSADLIETCFAGVPPAP